MHTVDSDLTFVFNFPVVVFDHTFVFAVHFGGHIGHQQFVCFTIVRLLVFGALFTDNFTVDEPLDAGPKLEKERIEWPFDLSLCRA